MVLPIVISAEEFGATVNALLGDPIGQLNGLRQEFAKVASVAAQDFRPLAKLLLESDFKVGPVIDLVLCPDARLAARVNAARFQPSSNRTIKVLEDHERESEERPIW